MSPLDTIYEQLLQLGNHVSPIVSTWVLRQPSLLAGSLDRRVVKIVYVAPGGEFKHHVFETDPATASVIRNKLNYILVMRTSPARNQYLSIKEKKLLRKQASFLLPN